MVYVLGKYKNPTRNGTMNSLKNMLMEKYRRPFIFK